MDRLECEGFTVPLSVKSVSTGLAEVKLTDKCSNGQSVMLYQQVSPHRTPTGLYACFQRVPHREYNLSARRIKGIIRK
jgi:hypothetical protein